MESKIKEKNGTFKLKFKCGFGLDRTQGGCQSVPCGHLVFSTIKPDTCMLISGVGTSAITEKSNHHHYY